MHHFTQSGLERPTSLANLPLKSWSIDLLPLSSVGRLLTSSRCSRLPTKVCGQGLPGSDHVLLRCPERIQLFLGYTLQDLPAGMYLLPCTHLIPLQFFKKSHFKNIWGCKLMLLKKKKLWTRYRSQESLYTLHLHCGPCYSRLTKLSQGIHTVRGLARLAPLKNSEHEWEPLPHWIWESNWLRFQTSI